jgi:hypothetical protein
VPCAGNIYAFAYSNGESRKEKIAAVRPGGILVEVVSSAENAQ